MNSRDYGEVTGTIDGPADPLAAIYRDHPNLEKIVEAMDASRAAAYAATDAAWQRILDLRADKAHAATQLAGLEKELEAGRLFKTVPVSGGGTVRVVDTDRIEAFRAKVEGLTRKVAAAIETHKKLSDAAKTTANGPSGYLARLRKIEYGPIVAPPVRKGESPLDALMRVRAEIADIEAEAKSVEKARLPTADRRKMVREQIEALAARGTPVVKDKLVAWNHIEIGPNRFIEDAIAAVAWLLKDELIARVVKMVPDHENMLTEKDKAARLVELADHKLGLERGEESLVRAVEEQMGQPYPRRNAADPRAVLGLLGPSPQELFAKKR
jgi:hypothetical protein